MWPLLVIVVGMLATPHKPVVHHVHVAAKPRPQPGYTFAAAGRKATSTLLHTYYAGSGSWRACDRAGCPTGDIDWGYDSLSYTLALRVSQTSDQSLVPTLGALTQSAREYATPCQQPTACIAWSDTAAWDAIALADEYQATHDPNALTKAEEALAYVADSSVFAGGKCSSIPYQKPGGGSGHIKTLETDANAVKAALLLYRATSNQTYLQWAMANYNSIRTYYLDRSVPLYTNYLFDNGQSCTTLPHRFFASVNGDMIWSGSELFHDTGQQSYLQQATDTATAVINHLADARGVYADLQAENDVVEPLVEGMDSLALRGQRGPRAWLLTNAAAALSARTRDGSFGRFFDGPPPTTTVTAWQTNGGLALEIVAASLAPRTVVHDTQRWASLSSVADELSSLPTQVTFRGSSIALLGTLGENCCEKGHARVLVDGVETFDGTGIWQDKSSAHLTIPGTILFAWRWPTAGQHTLTLLPGVVNAKEGGPFLHLVGYKLIKR